MLRKSPAWVWPLLAACDSTGPEAPPDLRTVPAAFAVLAGADQSDTIGARLASAITVQLQTDELEPRPIPGAIVNFVVLGDGCGRAFAGVALTDSIGRASERWDLGTRAGSCMMEARAVDGDGTPRVYDSIRATVRPGAAHQVSFGNATLTRFIGQTIDTSGLVSARDRAGNVATVSLSLNGALTSDTERYDTLTLNAGGQSARKPVIWIQDLRAQQWSLSAACRNATDSIVAVWAVDSVRYVGSDPRAFVRGVRVRYSATGQSVNHDNARPLDLTQTPGKLEHGGKALTGSGNSPIAYTGSLCGAGDFGAYATQLRPAAFQVGNPPPTPNLAPRATITAPTAGLRSRPPIVFKGTVTDPEDGSLPATWTSSVDDVLGTGDSISVDSLSWGTHTVTLSGTDSGGLTTQATVSISVPAPDGPDTEPPTLSGLALSTDTLNLTGGQTTLNLTVTVADNAAGVRLVSAQLYHEGANQYNGFIPLTRISGTEYSGVYRGTFAFTGSAARGRWTLRLQVSDAAGNANTTLAGGVTIR